MHVRFFYKPSFSYSAQFCSLLYCRGGLVSPKDAKPFLNSTCVWNFTNSTSSSNLDIFVKFHKLYVYVKLHKLDASVKFHELDIFVKFQDFCEISQTRHFREISWFMWNFTNIFFEISQTLHLCEISRSTLDLCKRRLSWNNCTPCEQRQVHVQLYVWERNWWVSILY